MNSDASSEASTWKLFSAPSLRIAVTPSSIEECRNAAVLENTRIRKRASGSLSRESTFTWVVRVAVPPLPSVTVSVTS